MVGGIDKSNDSGVCQVAFIDPCRQSNSHTRHDITNESEIFFNKFFPLLLGRFLIGAHTTPFEPTAPVKAPSSLTFRASDIL